MNKRFKEIITYKALGHKLSFAATGAFGDEIMESLVDSKQVKNVCAPLPNAVVERLESTIELLNLTKREFITQAIISALDESAEIIASLDIFEIDREIEAHKAKIEAQ